MPAQFDDWSPASVFGATISVEPPLLGPSWSAGELCEVQDPAPLASSNHRNQQLHAVSRLMNCHTTRAASTPDQLTTGDTLTSTDRKACRSAEEEAAAMVLASSVRLWLLWRRETESTRQVELLRLQLTQAAASTIQQSVRNYRTRRLIAAYLSSVEEFETRIAVLLNRIAALKQRREKENRMRRWLSACVQRRHLHHADQARRTHAHAMIVRFLRQAQRYRCARRASDDAVKIQRQVRRWQTDQRNRHVAAQKISQFARACSARRRTAKIVSQRRGLKRMHEVVRRSEARMMFKRWCVRTDDCHVFNASAVIVQRAFIRFRERERLKALGIRRTAGCIHFQRLARGHCARVRYRRLRSAIELQRIVRGFLVRKRVERLRRLLRERFRCNNCGTIEPSGMYCKLCGRRRANFAPISLAVLYEQDRGRHATLEHIFDLQSAAPLPKAPPVQFITPERPQLQPKLPSARPSPHRRRIVPVKPVVTKTLIPVQHTPASSPRSSGNYSELDGLAPLVVMPSQLLPAARSPVRSPRDHPNQGPVSLVGKSTSARAVELARFEGEQQAARQVQALQFHLRRIDRSQAAVGRAR